MDKDEELTQIEYFIDAYNQIAGKQLCLTEKRESPDFLCEIKHQEIIGVELCRIVRKNIVTHREIKKILREEMDYDDADIIGIILSNIIEKETKRREVYSKVTKQTMLVLSFTDIPISPSMIELALFLQNDFPDHGFSEIWFADYTLLDSHSDIRVFRLFPVEEGKVYKEINPNSKPYG